MEANGLLLMQESVRIPSDESHVKDDSPIQAKCSAQMMNSVKFEQQDQAYQPEWIQASEDIYLWNLWPFSERRLPLKKRLKSINLAEFSDEPDIVEPASVVEPTKPYGKDYKPLRREARFHPAPYEKPVTRSRTTRASLGEQQPSVSEPMPKRRKSTPKVGKENKLEENDENLQRNSQRRAWLVIKEL